MKKFYKNKKVFITGHTGFKGIWLVNILNHLGANVYGYSKNDQFKKNFRKFCYLKKGSNYFGDILNKKNLFEKLNKVKPDIVIHLAAQSLVKKSFLNPEETININIIGTLNLLECCRKIKTIKSIILATSDKCYENNNNKKYFKEEDKIGGDDPYSASKASCEIIINSYIKSFFFDNKKGIASVRAGNVIGGADWAKNRIIPDCARSIINKKNLYLRSPNSIRPWQHVLDVLNGYLILAKKLYEVKNKNKYNGNYNFGPSEKKHFDVKKVVKLFFKSIKLNKKIIFTKNNFGKEKNIILLSSKKSLKMLKWKQTINFEKTIKLTAMWYYNFINNKKNEIERQIILSKLF
jgi:CDP-glucose 4,6-dehydratase